jgi:predicted SprT family Zn-dependent metalloprotease
MRIIILFLITLASPTFAGEVIEAIYQEEVERAIKYAPPGITPTQMRLAAQERTNELFKKAAELYKLPIFQVTLTWGLLRDDVAGETSRCSELPYFLSLNEILFFHNFEEAISDYISHEVAHITTCFVHPKISKEEDFNAHGPEWQTIAKSLGSDGEQYHTLDTTPTGIYYIRLELLEATDQEQIDKLQYEMNILIDFMRATRTRY